MIIKRHFCPAPRERPPGAPQRYPPAAPPGVCVRPSRRAAAPRRSAPEHGLGRRSTPTAGAGHAPPWGRGGPARGDVGGMARGKLGVGGISNWIANAQF
jgi:hypothetical protein